ncbi:MAG: hypothetical protein OXS29_00695 [bacterium]|nr:hypothetical protein [bacterium]MDE0437436.1 hypothetical protein [bacterium]
MSLEWAHCSEYAGLQDAILRFREAQVGFDAASEALEVAEEGYRAALAREDPVRVADARAARDDATDAANAASETLLDALETLGEAELVALAAAETIVGDTSVDGDARYAAQAAVEAYAAASDAARHVASGDTARGVDTDAYRQAYPQAEAAAWATAGDDRAAADLRVGAARDRLATAEAAAAAADEAVAHAEDSVRDHRETLRAVTDNATRLIKTVRDEVESAAAPALAEARKPIEEQIRRLEMILAISGAWWLRDRAESVAHQAAFEDGSRYYLDAGGNEPWGSIVGRFLADRAILMADVALSAAVATRLDQLAHEAGLESDIAGYTDDLVSAFVTTWLDAGDIDWANRVDRAIRDDYALMADEAALFVFDRQPSYDTARYQQFVEFVRVAVAESVPAAVAVETATTEERLWAQGSELWEAFAHAQERLSRASIRGRHHPGTDGIAATALREALNGFRNEVMAKAASLRESRTEAPGFSPAEIEDKTNRDERVVTAQANVTQAQNQLDEATAQLDAAQTQARQARSRLEEARRELDRAQNQLDLARPDYRTALAAALLAVGHVAGCR